MEKKKVIIACTRRRVSEYIRAQLEEMLGGYAKVGMLLVSQEVSCRIRCDLVIAISEEIANQVAPFLIGDTEIIVLHLTIQRSMYDRLREIEGEDRAIVVNNTRELALETVALLYALDVKKIELLPYYPGCEEEYPDIRLAITPNEFGPIPAYIKKVVDIGERCLDPLTLIEVFSRLDCLNADSVEKIFVYGRNVVSINRGITELTRNGHNFGFGERQLFECFDDAVLLLDEKENVSLLNSSAQELFGKPYAYLIHKNIVELVPELKSSRDEIHNMPVALAGKRYLATWRFFSGREEGSSILVLKGIDGMRNLYARYGRENKNEALKYSFDDIVGTSEAMRAVKEKAKRFASTDFPVLIQGESGTGKELFAQAIHQASSRRNGPFVAFNCAALTDSLLESELFGYNEGAFTGANKKGRAGFFEMASGGTLFMDEIGDVSLNMQAKILRVLQEQEVVRVGGSQAIPVDVRIISATNQNLQQYVREKKFRLDLFYRLNTLILHLVPMRERPKDILDMLPVFFKKNHIKKNIDREAMNFMLQYPWPGNVRELQNCVSYLSIVEHDTICVEDFPEYMRQEPDHGSAVRPEGIPEGPSQDTVQGRGGARRRNVEQMILSELARCRREGEKTGRKRLSEALKQQGEMVSEAEIRIYLDKLQQKGFVEIQKGRGGTKITANGMENISNFSGYKMV